MGCRGEPLLAHAHLGLLDYTTYLALAEGWAADRAAGRLPDTVVTATHPPAVTVGRDAPDPEGELLAPAAELERRGLGPHLVERGGRATYHGPGQLMVYPVVDLGARGLGPADLAGLLLEAARSVLERWGTGPLEVRHGLWARGAKLASLGLGVSGGLTRHGLAVNLEPERGPGWSLVVPCGRPGLPVTDLLTLTGRRPDRRALGLALASALAGSLGCRAVPLAPEELLGKKPPWLVLRAAGGADEVPPDVPTVCEAADCPNRARCRLDGRRTYLLLGPACTRACTFCRVPDGSQPRPPDPEEPTRVARDVAALTAGRAGTPIRRVVLSSVTRDDLPDGGAAHLARAVAEVRRLAPGVEVEVLVPDFAGDPAALDAVLAARPDVVGHNLETVPRLYPSVRPGASYRGSLALLARAAAAGHETRSGLLLGLGEDPVEVLGVLRDLLRAGCRRLWLGQYLRPTPAHHPVARYAAPAEFMRLAAHARALGFDEVAAGPLVRSSCSDSGQGRKEGPEWW
ncbi:MAG: lipoyl synthase [Firmicutes bacterium]|nr:lipoyl synthase [Bacillota bacterium]